MEQFENQEIRLDDYSKERLSNIATMYGLSVGAFFITDPKKVLSSMLASLQLRSAFLSQAYQEFVNIDISFLKGLLYDATCC